MHHTISKNKCFVLLLFTLVLSSLNVSAQENILEVEEELAKLYALQMQTPSEETSTNIEKAWQSIANQTGFSNYEFTKLKQCKILSPEKKEFTIVTWADPFHHPSPNYYGFIVVTGKNGNKVWTLKSNNTLQEKGTVNSEHWYGSIYYKLIENKAKGKTVYTLLGWSPLDKSINQKTIDVVTVNENECLFGAPVFVPNKANQREVFRYSKQTSMTLNYQDNTIIVDHLAPSSPDRKGVYEYYGPDMTFDSYTWKKGVWVREEVK